MSDTSSAISLYLRIVAIVAAFATVIVGRAVRVVMSAASGAPSGTKIRTSTSGSCSNALSMSGLTSAQSSPPLPQPNGGTAIELIDFSRTTRTRSASPASMSGSRERARQCPLVGKLMTNRGPVTAPVSQTCI